VVLRVQLLSVGVPALSVTCCQVLYTPI